MFPQLVVRFLQICLVIWGVRWTLIQKVPGGGGILWTELLENTAGENLAEVEQAEDIQGVETHYMLQWRLY